MSTMDRTDDAASVGSDSSLRSDPNSPNGQAQTPQNDSDTSTKPENVDNIIIDPSVNMPPKPPPESPPHASTSSSSLVVLANATVPMSSRGSSTTTGAGTTLFSLSPSPTVSSASPSITPPAQQVSHTTPTQRGATPSATPSVAVSVAGGRNAQGQSALHITAAACNVAAISLLLDGGFDPNAEDADGRTPLMLLCLPLPQPGAANPPSARKAGAKAPNPASYNSDSRIACFKALIEHEADVNVQHRDSGNTALHLLVLFAADADEALDASSSTSGGEIRLDTAINCLNYLVKSDADISLINFDGDTPLHLAAKLGQLHMMKAIMAAADAKQREAPSDIDSVMEASVGQPSAVVSDADDSHISRGGGRGMVSMASPVSLFDSPARLPVYPPTLSNGRESEPELRGLHHGADARDQGKVEEIDGGEVEEELDASSSSINPENVSRIPAEWKANKHAPTQPSLWDAMNPSAPSSMSPDASPIRLTSFDPHYYSDFEGNNDSYFEGHNDSFVETQTVDQDADPVMDNDEAAGYVNNDTNNAYYEGTEVDEVHNNGVYSEAKGADDYAYAEALPEGWTEYMSEEGYIYYYNHITGESSWDRPVSIASYDYKDEAAVANAEQYPSNQEAYYYGDEYNGYYANTADQNQYQHQQYDYQQQQQYQPQGPQSYDHNQVTTYQQQPSYGYPSFPAAAVATTTTVAASPELPRPTGGMKTVVIESKTGNIVPMPTNINIARANSSQLAAVSSQGMFSPHSPMVPVTSAINDANSYGQNIAIDYDYGMTPVKANSGPTASSPQINTLPLPYKINNPISIAAPSPLAGMNPDAALSPSAGFFSPMASTPAQYRPPPADFATNIRRNLESEMTTPPPSNKMKGTIHVQEPDPSEMTNRLTAGAAVATANEDSFVNYDIDQRNELSNVSREEIGASSALSARHRNPSISSLSDDQSDVSTVTNKHLEVWNRFFENALKSGEVNRQKQLLRQFTANPADMAERRAKQKKSKSSRSAKPTYAAAPATTSLDDNGWPLPLDEGTYAELIGNALSKLATSFNGEELDSSPTAGYALGTIALLAASSCADTPTVEELLSLGVHPSCVDSQIRTPLHHCARLGSVDIAALLVEYEADADARDVRGQTPLHVACSFGHVDMVRFLLESAAVADTRDDNGGVPMHFAAGGGHVDCIKLLHEYGASPIAVDSFGSSVMDVLVSRAPKSAQTQRMAAIMRSWAEEETRRLAETRRQTREGTSANEKSSGGGGQYQQPMERPRSQRGSQPAPIYSSDSDDDMRDSRRGGSRSLPSGLSRNKSDGSYDEAPKKKTNRSSKSSDVLPPSSRAAEIRRLAAIEKRKSGEDADSPASKGVILLANAVDKASRSGSSRIASKASGRERLVSDASALDNVSVNSGGSSVSSRSSQFIDPRSLRDSTSSRLSGAHEAQRWQGDFSSSNNMYPGAYEQGRMGDIHELASPPRAVSKYDTFDAEAPISADIATRSTKARDAGEDKLSTAASDDSDDTPSSALGGVTRAVGGFMWGAASSLIGATVSMLTAPRRTESSENIDEVAKGFGPPPPPPTDFELQQQGLGFLPPSDASPMMGNSRRRMPIPESPRPPPIVAAELDAYMTAYKKGLTPRRRNLAPPADVAAAVAAASGYGETCTKTDSYEAIVATKRPTPLELPKSSEDSPAPSKLETVPESHAASGGYQPEPPSRYNNYSMGTIPNGVRWRYVDVFNNGMDDSNPTGSGLRQSPSKKKASSSPRKLSSSARSKKTSPNGYESGSSRKIPV